MRRLYAGAAGAVLRTLSYLSMHLPLSESPLHDLSLICVARKETSFRNSADPL